MTDIWIQIRRVVGGVETILEVTVTAEVARDRDLFERVIASALSEREHGDFVGFTAPVTGHGAGGYGTEFIRHGHGTNVRI